MRLLK
jgi:hypothetical protein